MTTSCIRGLKENPSTSSSSSSALSLSPVTSVNQESDPRPPARNEIKTLFKKLCRQYQKRQTPPTDKEMAPLWRMREYVDFEDIVAWRDEAGVKKGVVYENGKVLFNQWPVPPHEHIVSEFNAQFNDQFSSTFRGTPHYPVFTNDGTSGIYLSRRMNLMRQTFVSLELVEINNPTLHGGPAIVHKPLSPTPWSHSSRSNQTGTHTLPSSWKLGITSQSRILSASVIACCPGEPPSMYLFSLLIIATRLEQLTVGSYKSLFETILLRSHRPGLAQTIPPVLCYMRPPKSELAIQESITPSPKALKSTTSKLAISTAPRHTPSSTLLSRHCSELMLRKFVQPLSLTAAHK